MSTFFSFFLNRGKGRVIIFQGMGCFVLDLFFLRLCIDRVFDPSLM